ncbi:MAG TPA: AtpZ/AtpI family protein [Rhizomicrobium sp.]|nr:AtpZ/AtpI family protein [Rhizomicrobium sp.]
MSDEPPEPDDLRRLSERLDEARRREAAKAPKAGNAAPLSVAFRFTTELVAALVVGGALGWGMDRLFGTRPIFMVVMFFLGAAAGIRNVMGAAKEMNERAAKAAMDDKAGNKE